MRSLSDEAARMTSAVAEAGPVVVPTTTGPLAGLASRPMVPVYDEVLLHPIAYRHRLLDLPFGDVSVGDVTFRGIADVTDRTMADAVTARWPDLQPTLTFARLSPAGQEEPHFIHTDRDMGEWTAILYLTDPPDPGDGTTFWAHAETGICLSTADTPDAFAAEHRAWRDASQWRPWRMVEARFNRLVIFPASAFHSRTIRENYGTGASARLTQVMFGTFKETP